MPTLKPPVVIRLTFYVVECSRTAQEVARRKETRCAHWFFRTSLLFSPPARTPSAAVPTGDSARPPRPLSAVVAKMAAGAAQRKDEAAQPRYGAETSA